MMRLRVCCAAALLAGTVAAVAACGDRDAPAANVAVELAAQSGRAPAFELPPSRLETQLPPALRDLVLTPATGDLDAMVKRRLVRIGVTVNRTFYFIDKGVQRGVAYEYGQLFEQRLNEHVGTGAFDKVHVVFMPLPRSQLLPALVAGKVDLVAAQVTMRPELQQFVDFTDPTRMNVSQVLVTAAGEPPVATVAGLSGREVFTRETGSYHESLVALNERFTAKGWAPVVIRPVPDNLEDDDLLEMVNAGLIPAIVVDDYLAHFWKQVFPNITVHHDIVQ